MPSSLYAVVASADASRTSGNAARRGGPHDAIHFYVAHPDGSRKLARTVQGRAYLTSSGSTVGTDRKSTRLNSSHRCISYAVFCLKKKKKRILNIHQHRTIIRIVSKHDGSTT